MYIVLCCTAIGFIFAAEIFHRSGEKLPIALLLAFQTGGLAGALIGTVIYFAIRFLSH